MSEKGVGAKKGEGQKQAEEALRGSEEQLRDLFENASDLIQSVAPDGHFVYVNRAWRKMLGYNEDEVTNLTLWDIIHPDSIPHCKEVFQKVLLGETVNNVETIFVAKDGRLVTVEGNANCRLERGKPVATRGIFRDITERKRMEQELIEKTKEVERATQAKSEFLSHMSHELRTPLNIIIGFSELMIDEAMGKINDKQKQCLSDILDSSHHLLNLINGVLDLSKIESGKMELKLKNIALSKLIEPLTRTMMPILTPRKQSLDVEIENDLPPVHADKAKLKQVFLNLLSNATWFSPDGGRLKIEAVRKGDWCQVSVIDNGTGIKKEDQERIFEPFCQLDNPPTREKGGTGLGLTLVKQIVEKHGGQIRAESEYGKGSQFIFTLPLATNNQRQIWRGRQAAKEKTPIQKLARQETFEVNC